MDKDMDMAKDKDKDKDKDKHPHTHKDKHIWVDGQGHGHGPLDETNTQRAPKGAQSDSKDLPKQLLETLCVHIVNMHPSW